jgi:uncharacterized protein YchJ
MDTESGKLIPWDDLKELPSERKNKFIEVKRDLTKLEELNRQIELYSPCACGSGKKLKFCCYRP